MTLSPRIMFFALISVLLAGPGALAADEDEVHFCQDDEGNIILQTDPCPEPAEPEVASPTRPQASPPAPVPQPARPRPPTPPVATAPATVARPTSIPARRSTSGWMLIPRSPSIAATPRRRLGKQSFPTSLAGTTRPTGPSFATPERTWLTFVSAIERGDHGAAGACLTPDALERFGSDVASIPLDELRSMLGELTRIENGGDLGPFWSIRGVRANQRPKWIFFEETADGEWKIAGI